MSRAELRRPAGLVVLMFAVALTGCRGGERPEADEPAAATATDPHAAHRAAADARDTAGHDEHAGHDGAGHDEPAGHAGPHTAQAGAADHAEHGATDRHDAAAHADHAPTAAAHAAHDAAAAQQQHADHAGHAAAAARAEHAEHAVAPTQVAGDAHAGHDMPVGRTGEAAGATLGTLVAALLDDDVVRTRIRQDAALAELSTDADLLDHVAHAGEMMAGMAGLLELASGLVEDPAVIARIEADAALGALWADGVGAALSPRDAVMDSAEVAAVVDRFHAALTTGDSAAALALLAPDATILEAGNVETLDEYRAHHLPADIEFARAVPRTRGPIRVTVHGNTAWAVSSSTSQGEFRGRSINSETAELIVLVRTPDGWRISAIHWSSRTLRG